MMSPAQLLWFLKLSHSRGIVRRYFVVNGFDGALTMLGLLTGFYLSGIEELRVVIAACLGAAIALGVSGLSSAYLSESAERRRLLGKLEEAMLADLSQSAYASAARLVPLLIALVNGVAPLLLSLLIILPLWLAQRGYAFTSTPLLAAIGSAFVCIFGLGAFLGRVGGTHWLWSGIKSLLIAAVTVLLILTLES